MQVFLASRSFRAILVLRVQGSLASHVLGVVPLVRMHVFLGFEFSCGEAAFEAAGFLGSTRF